MTDNEFLLVMSNMMDDKLKPVNEKLESVERTQKKMSGRLESVEQKQEEMSDRMDKEFKRVDERLDKVDKEFEAVNNRLDRVEQTQEEMLDKMGKEFELVNERIKGVEQVQEEMSGRLKKMEITHENDILPRLQNIEECYISTYKRYQEGGDQIPNMQTSISVIEKIVAEHSDQIQKLQVVNS